MFLDLLGKRSNDYFPPTTLPTRPTLLSPDLSDPSSLSNPLRPFQGGGRVGRVGGWKVWKGRKGRGEFGSAAPTLWVWRTMEGRWYVYGMVCYWTDENGSDPPVGGWVGVGVRVGVGLGALNTGHEPRAF